MEGYSSSSSYDDEISNKYMSVKKNMGDTAKAGVLAKSSGWIQDVKESLPPLEKEEKYKILNFFAEFSELGMKRAQNKKDSVNNSLSIRQSDTKQYDEFQQIVINEYTRKTMYMDIGVFNSVWENSSNEWFEKPQRKKAPFQEVLQKYMFAGVKQNVCIVIGKESFECNPILLQCYSKTFISVNANKGKQLNMGDITMKVFRKVYEWMLSAKTIPICDDTIMAMFNAAELLGIDELKEQCWRCLDNDLIVREQAAFDLYLQSKLYTQMGFLLELLLGRVSKFFLTLVASRDFLELDVNEVCALLSSHSISVNMEAEVMMSAIHWMKHNEEERVQHTEKLMECIRFTLMPSAYLVKLKDGKICKETNELVSFPYVKRNIVTCLKYLNRIQCGSIAPEHSIHFMLENRSMIVRERQWIMDVKCGYHHHFQCKTRTCLTYDQFKKYIKEVNERDTKSWNENHFINSIKETKTEKCLNANCPNTSLIPYRKMIKNPELFKKFDLHVLGQTYKSFAAFQSKMDAIKKQIEGNKIYIQYN